MIIGAILNGIGILLGGFLGYFRKSDVPLLDQNVIKKFLGVFAVYAGLKLTWDGVGGGFLNILKQMLIMVIGMSIGKIVGRILRLQKTSNAIGQYAAKRLEAPRNRSDSLVVPTLLFCAAPLGVFGAVQDGLHNYPYALILKGIMDGMAAFAFSRTFGISVVGAALPVLALEGTITLLCRSLEPTLRTAGVLDPLLATSGLLVFCVALVILELKRIELADYIPSLVTVPLLAYFWRW